jgi:hypothetical protein
MECITATIMANGVLQMKTDEWKNTVVEISSLLGYKESRK